MKQFFLLLCMACAVNVFGQKPIVEINAMGYGESFPELRDRIFDDIDLSIVPSGYLREYSIFLEDPLYHTGIDEKHTLNINRWRMLYAGLKGAAVNNKADKLPELDTLNKKFSNLKKENTILLPLLWFEYNSYNTEEVSFTETGIEQFTDNKDSLYYLNELFAVAPSATRIKGNSFSFVFSPDFTFTNKNVIPEKLLIDFGDGNGTIELMLGETRKVDYPTEGEKTIIIRYVTQDNTILTSKSVLTIEKEPIYSTNGNLKSMSIDAEGEVTGRAYSGSSATINYEILLGTGNSILDKPFFILEGFDPYNSYDIGRFITDIYSSGLLVPLLNNGYDLVFVNYEDGTDYIQRNAYALEELINLVNEEKNLNCKVKYDNVIMGFSMGGLVARYALVDMENLSEEHDTRLYISYDSPHRGANVPFSYQLLTKEMYDFDFLGFKITDIVPDLADAYEMMDSPAARQMLILQALNLNGGTFIDDLASLGMPQQCRIVALANGSMQSVNYPEFQPEQKLLDFHYEKSILGDLWHIKMDANCYALADSPPSPKRVFEFYYKIITWTNFEADAATFPYDNAPGGVYDLVDFGFDPDELLPSDASYELTSNGFCFVPTASAFDIPINATSLQASITSANQTSFDAIFINNSSDNESHIDLTSQKVNWILQQIAIGDVIDCDASCLSISGPGYVCSGGASFSVDDLYPGATIEWVQSGNITRVSPQGSNPCTFSANGSGEGWIEAIITGSCNTTILSLEHIIVGTTVIIGLDGPMYVPTHQDTRYYPLYQDIASSPTNFMWMVTPDDGVSYDSYGWSTLVNFSNPGYYNIVYRGLNTCGWGDWYMSDNIYVYSSRSLSLTPNPTSGETIIAIETPDKKATSTTETEEMAFDETAEWELEIFDNVQNMIAKKTKLKGKEYRINTAGWIDGVYMIRVKYKDEVLTGKLVVKQ